MMERTYENIRENRHKPTTAGSGSKRVRKRSYRSVTVCLVLVCVLLLTAVIVLCVLINTNNQQCQNLKNERDQLWKELRRCLNTTDGWFSYQSSLYFISSEMKSWTESRRYCMERGADLIIINNKEKQDLIKISGTDSFWIGLSDIEEEGKWKWVDNSTLTTSFWAPGDPTGQRGYEDCVQSKSSVWFTYSCTSKFNWICEKTIL